MFCEDWFMPQFEFIARRFSQNVGRIKSVNNDRDRPKVIYSFRDSLSRGATTKMGKNEKTGKSVGSIASKGLQKPSSLTTKEIKTLAASALTQRPDHKKPTGRK
jgi:hypothetical protein